MSTTNSDTGYAPYPETEQDRRIARLLKADKLRRLVQEGIDSGPGVDAGTVFARLRERFIRSSSAS